LREANHETGDVELYNTGERFEFGSRNFSVLAGMNATLDWFESLGWQNVYEHIRNYSSWFKDRINERPYATLVSPMPFEQSSGLVSFEVEGFTAETLIPALLEKCKAYTRPILMNKGIRISTAHYVTVEDLEAFLQALDELARK
jgi:selenocysteine lyase/cysteine desulfurase